MKIRECFFPRAATIFLLTFTLPRCISGALVLPPPTVRRRVRDRNVRLTTWMDRVATCWGSNVWVLVFSGRNVGGRNVKAQYFWPVQQL